MAALSDAATRVRSSSLAVVAWVEDGRPRATGVVALTRGDTPVLALPFAHVDLAVALERAGESTSPAPLALAMVEPRGTSQGFTPTLVTARPDLRADLSGDVYVGELILEDLRRYPPSRLLADSPILCREHWWYLPRLVVELTEPTATDLGAPGPAGQLLVTVDGTAPRVTRVESPAGDAGIGPLPLRILGGDPPTAGAALLFDQDASFPDLERWVEWSWQGTLDLSAGEPVLDVELPPARIGLPATKPLLRRWRHHRELARACRAGLERWESGADSA